MKHSSSNFLEQVHNTFYAFLNRINIKVKHLQLHPGFEFWLPISSIMMNMRPYFYHKGFSDYCLHLYCYFYDISAGGHISWNVVEITTKTIAQKPFFRGLSNSVTFTKFELHPLFNPQWSPVLIQLAITGYKFQVFLYCYSPAVRIKPATSRWLSP